MSNERQETIADIVTEMRIGDLCAEDTSAARPAYINNFLDSYADRIEAAWMREREAGAAAACEQPVTDCNRFGNAAAMREALNAIKDTLDEWRTNGEMMEHWQYSELFGIANAAISAPPRNCDVGTAEEQCRRFLKFCHGEICENCPVHDARSCNLAWAQLPYGEGGAKC